MKKLLFLLPTLLLMGIGGKCSNGSDARRDWPQPGPLLYTSPGGLGVYWLGPGVSWHNSTGISSSGTSWQTLITWDDIGMAMDYQVQQFINAHPTISVQAVWNQAREIKYFLEDDYLFPVIDNPSDFPNASYATGESLFGGTVNYMDIAIWSKQYTDQEPASPPTPAWTIRAPYFVTNGQSNGSPQWHSGAAPYCPALSYELGWWFGVN